MNPNFNTSPEVPVILTENPLLSGWEAITGRLVQELSTLPGTVKTLAVECYPGVQDAEILGALLVGLKPDCLFHTKELFREESDILAMTHPFVTDDRIFGTMSDLVMEDFIDPEKLAAFREHLAQLQSGLVVVYGPGALVACPQPDLPVYIDMARWEIQLRMRRNEVCSLGLNNAGDPMEAKYKRGYFVDWRVCDRLKRTVLPRCKWVLDTNRAGDPAMVPVEALFEGFSQTAARPFSVVPYFDAGPWGGQWMKETFGLDPTVSNYAWCFNCVPEENSLYLAFGGRRFETPSINLVFFRPDELLGRKVRERFGEEFPIRFDFLDTMGGGNLSLQVHPLEEYIRETFGMTYTQDESYYLMEAGEGARVYLGLKEGVDPTAMARDLRAAESGETPFDDTAHVRSWPAKKHDHFLIPGGTVHCSGQDCMVLEISATPYIFTFKLWDWGRMGLDGRPRPINIGHGLKNIRWERTDRWVEENLVNRVLPVAEGPGWNEEHTGLHELEFIETHRHRFTAAVPHHTGWGVNVLCLVGGREVLVESPTGAFDPFPVHYAETFIIPAAVGPYSIRPYGESEGSECITVKAFIRNR